MADVSPPAPADLTDVSTWRPLRLLTESIDRDIAELYIETGLGDVRPRYVGPLIQLGRRGPLTIQQLADAVDVTHSAMSQTVASMRKQGLVESAAGADARTRQIALTAQARAVLPFLEAEWRATEAALIELEAEIPYALNRVVDDIREALARRPFAERLRAHLPDRPDRSAE